MTRVENGAGKTRSLSRFRDDGDVAEITDTAGMDRASARDAAAPRGEALAPLTAVNASLWRELAGCAIEPNGYYLPEWELAVNAFAPGRGAASMLAAWRDASPPRLIGLMPVVSLWRAWRIPLPALVSAHPYGTLCTPPLDRDVAEDAAARLMQQARRAGARALILRDMSLDGAAMKAFSDAVRRDGLRPRVLQSGLRACLDATRNGDQLLHDALGARKLKELRRQRSRLAEHGTVAFDVARTRDEVSAALEIFLKLEASGWKGQRGTALIQRDGDASFIRRAAIALAATGQCEIVSLRAGDTPIAAAIVLRHLAPRLLLQARHRRALREVFTGGAAHPRPDAAPLRRSRDHIGGFHRQPRSSHDQPDLARPPGDRRRADPAAAERSSGMADQGRDDPAPLGPRAGPPRRPPDPRPAAEAQPLIAQHRADAHSALQTYTNGPA